MAVSLSLHAKDEEGFRLKFVSLDKTNKPTDFNRICFYAFLLCTARNTKPCATILLRDFPILARNTQIHQHFNESNENMQHY